MHRIALALSLLVAVSACAITAPATHDLIAPGSLERGEQAAEIVVLSNVDVMIVELDGRPGPNKHQIAGFPSVYNNTFTQAARLLVLPGQRELRVACRYQPGIFSISQYRARRLSLELLPGETMWLHAPEQEKAQAAGLILPRDNVCPIRVKSSQRGERILPDPG